MKVGNLDGTPLTAAELRAAILELIHDRWQQAKIEQNTREDSEEHEWAEVARGKAETLMELAADVRKLTASDVRQELDAKIDDWAKRHNPYADGLEPKRNASKVTDIVNRLRASNSNGAMCDEAATDIERLRSIIAQIADVLLKAANR
jgi:hypothetical protein